MNRRKKGQFGDVWKRLRKNKLAMVSMVIVFILVFSSIFANYIAPYEPDAASFGERLQLPSKAHLLGTDNFGRDILTRIIYGGRTSLLVATMGTVISLVLGCFFGLTAAYYGGPYETVVMRLNDILMAIPTNLMAICISAVLGGGVFNTALAVSIGGIPGYLRLMRASAMSIREQEFVEAARATGSKSLRIMLKHILPNTLSTIIVQATMGIGGTRTLRKEIEDPAFRAKMYRSKINGIYRMPNRADAWPQAPEMDIKYGEEFGGGQRSVDYPHEQEGRRFMLINFMGRDFALRHIHNFIGDRGKLENIRWGIMSPDSLHARGYDVPQSPNAVDFLAVVPEKAGKPILIHGMERDVAWVKSYVYDKYCEDGKHYVKLAWWIDTIEGETYESGQAVVSLPSRNGDI